MHKKLLLLDEIRVVLKLTSALWVTNFVNFLFSDSTKVHEKKKEEIKLKIKKIIHVIFPHVVPFIIFLRLDVIKQKEMRGAKKKKKNSKYMHIPIDLEEQSRRKPCPADTYLFRTEIREVQPLSLVRHVSGCRNNRHDEHMYEMPYIYDATLCVPCAKG